MAEKRIDTAIVESFSAETTDNQSTKFPPQTLMYKKKKKKKKMDKLCSTVIS